MRDNGLPAQAWTHVADLDPRVAEAALDALGRAGVAAYTTPHAGRAGAYLDVQLPDRPTDRLYVESGARERAAAVLAQLQRDSRPEDQDAFEDLDGAAAAVDATFAEIVAQFELEAPDREPLEPSSGPSDGPELRTDPSRAFGATIGWDDLLADHHTPDPEPDDPEDTFVPPPPPEVPRGTPLRRFAWLAVLGAPLVVVLCVLVDYPLDGWTGLLVIGAFVGGLATLFATLDDTAPDDDDPDHGAVV